MRTARSASSSLRDRRSPDGHHRVADELLDGAAVALDQSLARLEVPREELARVLGVAALGRGREADEVGKQDGDEPALDADPRRSGDRGRLGDIEGGAAVAAEALVGRVLAAATRAHRGERAATVAAEAHPRRILSTAARAGTHGDSLGFCRRVVDDGGQRPCAYPGRRGTPETSAETFPPRGLDRSRARHGRRRGVRSGGRPAVGSEPRAGTTPRLRGCTCSSSRAGSRACARSRPTGPRSRSSQPRPADAAQAARARRDGSRCASSCAAPAGPPGRSAPSGTSGSRVQTPVAQILDRWPTGAQPRIRFDMPVSTVTVGGKRSPHRRRRSRSPPRNRPAP